MAVTTETPLTLQTSTRWLECRLTEEERRFRADRAAELSALSAEDARREEMHKGEQKSAKEAKEAKEKEAGQLLGIYRAGKESRNVETREEYDGSEVLVVRTDTEAVVERRKPGEQDWKRIRDAQQTRLSFSKAEKVLADVKKQAAEEKAPAPGVEVPQAAEPKAARKPRAASPTDKGAA